MGLGLDAFSRVGNTVSTVKNTIQRRWGRARVRVRVRVGARVRVRVIVGACSPMKERKVAGRSEGRSRGDRAGMLAYEGEEDEFDRQRAVDRLRGAHEAVEDGVV